MIDVGNMLLGAALVAIGVLAAALADRIRGLRITRERAVMSTPTSPPVHDPDPVATPKPGRARTPQSRSKTHTQQTADDVIAALVAAGHKKQVATDAVWGCRDAERTTIEQWTLASLRRCAPGEIS